MGDCFFMKILLGALTFKSRRVYEGAFRHFPLEVSAGKKGAQASDLLFLVRRVVEAGETWADLGGLCIAKADLWKAFDRLHHFALGEMLAEIGMQRVDIKTFLATLIFGGVSPTIADIVLLWH